MPKYRYTAVDVQNKKVTDVLEAKDENELRKILWSYGLVSLKYTQIEKNRKDYRLKPDESAEFSRQLASMLSSGITVVRVMEILGERDFKPQLKQVYHRLYNDVQQGYTLSEAMRLQTNAFPELLINMYASGEASGQLDKVASKMAVHYEKEHRLNRKVQAAMTYPAILFTVTAGVVMVIFTVILPEFFAFLKDAELPLLTRGVIALSGFLQKQWYIVIIAILVIIVLVRSIFTIHAAALKGDRAKLRFPIIGKLLKIIYTARFSRTLSSLYSSGISMLTALEITSTIIANKYIESQFDEVIRNVRNGEPLSAAVDKVDGFDKKLAISILIGEESGRLDGMLESTAESFDYEAEMATAKLVQLVEPVMIVIMAVIIGAIMLSVVLPVLTLYQSVGNM